MTVLRLISVGRSVSAIPARIALSIASRSLPSSTVSVCQPYASKRFGTSSWSNERLVGPSIVIELSS